MNGPIGVGTNEVVHVLAPLDLGSRTWENCLYKLLSVVKCIWESVEPSEVLCRRSSNGCAASSGAGVWAERRAHLELAARARSHRSIRSHFDGVM